MVKNSKLLIVDDESLLTKILEFTLKDVAEEIYIANAGDHALATVKQIDIGCVLCDINLPFMNGIEICRRVRALGHRMPFVFFSGEEDRNYLIEAAKLGAIDFLFKPQFTGLKKAVQAALLNQHYRPDPTGRYGTILRDLNLYGPELF